VTYSSYLIRPAGWLDDEGDFHYLDEADKDAPPATWTLLYTLHNAVAPQEELPAPDLFGEHDSSVYRVPPCPHGTLIDLYHGLLPTCDRVMLHSDTRNAATRARWREVCSQAKLSSAEGVEFFKTFFASVAKSDFLMGRVPSRERRPFKADFLWLMRPTNFVKVCEGKYK
jgi:hypothetical protein